MNLQTLLQLGLLSLTAAAAGPPLVTTIETDTLKVQYLSPGGTFALVAKPSQRTFVSATVPGREPGTAVTTRVHHRTFGRGQAIEVSYPDGGKDAVRLFPKLPFALVQSRLHNGAREVATTPTFKALAATVDLGKPANQLKTLGTGGLLAADKNPGSYAWLAVAEPESRHGVVFGWLTHDRGSGVVFSEVRPVVNHTADGSVTTNQSVNVQAQIDYGKLRLAPGKSEELETLAVGWFEDARLGLEQWADAVARVYDIKLRAQPTGYCTWYSQPHGGAADEQSLATLAEFAARELKPFGFSVVQIDDKWQAGWKRASPGSPKKDFRTHDPNGPYPHGMKAAADRIQSLGLVPGIWFMPFAGTIGDPFFDQHRDWFVQTAAGQPYDTPWGGASLDMTHPGARAHLREVAGRICREWGYEYIKIDGLWTGTATKQLYVNSGYKPDDLGDAIFANPEKTAIEAYRAGLKLVREAAGKNVFILGCNGPQNMRSYGGAFGLVDAMRVGPDNGAEWKSLTRGPLFGSRHYFLHRRVWLNDPDPVYVRPSMPRNHAQLICSWVALSGQLNLSSEWLPGLPRERLDLLKRTLPGHRATARPVDLFANEPPRVWTVSQARDRLVVGLYNWTNAEQPFDVALADLGLSGAADYIAFEYWSNRFLPSVRGRLRLSVPAESCAVLALRPAADHPQVISTSRHVTQGLVDLSGERWSARTKTLSGRSRLVGGDPYELRVAIGSANLRSVQVSAADRAAGVKISQAKDGSVIRVQLASPSSREVAWRLQFQSPANPARAAGAGDFKPGPTRLAAVPPPPFAETPAVTQP